jgi:hypothetical protein
MSRYGFFDGEGKRWQKLCCSRDSAAAQVPRLRTLKASKLGRAWLCCGSGWHVVGLKLS